MLWTAKTQQDCTYMFMLVSQHKTSKSYGAAVISVPISLYREMLAYYQKFVPAVDWTSAGQTLKYGNQGEGQEEPVKRT